MTDAPCRAAPDLPVSWHLAVIRAIVHTASYESQSGRISDSEAEAAIRLMLRPA
jgi:hypothetical protein